MATVNESDQITRASRKADNREKLDISCQIPNCQEFDWKKDKVRSSFCLDSGKSILFIFSICFFSQRETKMQWKSIVIKAEKWTENIEKGYKNEQ